VTWKLYKLAFEEGVKAIEEISPTPVFVKPPEDYDQI
jgi:hypothetical protein